MAQEGDNVGDFFPPGQTLFFSFLVGRKACFKYKLFFFKANCTSDLNLDCLLIVGKSYLDIVINFI